MRKLISFLLSGIIFTACSSIDCPLNNRVYTTYKLTGDVDTLKDTLTVKADLGDGNDSVLLNRVVAIDSFPLPLSYNRKADTFYFTMKDTTSTVIDTVTVTKENRPHFESVDCSPAVFHTITGVSFTRHKISSIDINNPNVTYDATKPTFHISFKSSSK